MKQEDYRSCMAKNMGGGRLKGLSKEERRMEFCVIAKGCAKGMPAEEAARLCAEAASEPPKPRKSRGIDPAKLAACVSANINIEELTIDNLPTRLEVAISHCSITNSPSPPTYKRFMNACLKETGGAVDFIKSQRIIKECQDKWNEKRGAQ